MLGGRILGPITDTFIVSEQVVKKCLKTLILSDQIDVVRCSFLARICGGCGFSEFYVENVASLAATLRRTNGQ